MRYTKWFAGLALAVGLGATTLSAQDWNTYRDISRDHNRIAAMRADMARDQARLNEDIRCGRSAQARRDAADLARDQRALNAQVRDVRHDERDAYRSSYRWR